MEKESRFKKFYKNHSLKRKIETREYQRRLRKATLDLLGGKCIRCEFSDFRALQIDHINGGGNKDIKKKGRGGQYYNQVIKSFLNNENVYQLLCANCNWIKRSENKENRQITNF